MMGPRPADSYRAHSRLPREYARVVEHSAAINAAHCEYPVNPSFQNGWQAEPPQGKLKDQSIAPEELVHLVLNIRSKAVILGCVDLFLLLPQIGGVSYSDEVAAG